MADDEKKEQEAEAAFRGSSVVAEADVRRRRFRSEECSSQKAPPTTQLKYHRCYRGKLESSLNLTRKPKKMALLQVEGRRMLYHKCMNEVLRQNTFFGSSNLFHQNKCCRNSSTFICLSSTAV